MTTTPAGQGGAEGEMFASYMIRVRRPRASGDGAELAGVVERLATGEKRSFESAGELAHLLGAWPQRRRSIEGPTLG